MHIITHRRLREFWEKHPNAQSSLQIWYSRTREANWENFVQLCQVFPILGSYNSNNYLELLQAFPPRPIASEENYIATQTVIDSLIDKEELTLEEQDYLNVLGSLIRDYEEIYHPLLTLKGVELIKALLEDMSLDAQDLIPIFETEWLIEEVLSGKSALTTIHLQKLAQFFNMPASAFLD